MPAGARDASGGRWARGPGRAVFDAAHAELGRLPVIAEDLGVITPAVTRLRESLGLPGMVVLQFGFNADERDSVHRPQPLPRRPGPLHGHARQRHAARLVRVAAAGVGRAGARARACRGREPWWGLMELALSSKPRLCMLQAQDVLGLGSEARMNMPGVAGGQWSWRLRPGQLTPALARRLRRLTADAGRLP